MKILFITATYLPTINGVSYQISLLAQALRTQGHEVLIFAPRHHCAPQSETGVIRYPSLKTLLAPDYPLGFPLHPPPALLDFRPDVIHTHHPFHLGYFAVRLGRRLKQPVFFTHHTQYTAYASHYLPILKRPASAFINTHLRHFSKQLSAVICPSQTLQKHLNQLGIKHTVYIRNGIDLNAFRPQTQAPSPLSLIYVGRLDKEKSPKKLIKFAQALRRQDPATRLTLVGNGSQISRLKALTARLQLDAVVTFTGPVGRPRLPRLLNQHHFFISFSQSEVLPLSFIEALAGGLPLALPAAANYDPAFNPQNCLFLPDSMTQAARQILACYHNQTQYQSLRRHALKTAQNFSIRHTADLHLQLYYQYRSYDP